MAMEKIHEYETRNEKLNAAVGSASVSDNIEISGNESQGSRFGSYQTASNWFLWADLAVYALLLVLWRGLRLLSVLFPLALLQEFQR
jgi:hypothetical protein